MLVQQNAARLDAATAPSPLLPPASDERDGLSAHLVAPVDPAMADAVAGGVDFVTASLPEGRAMSK